jgi:predicted nucleic acid-binding protein
MGWVRDQRERQVLRQFSSVVIDLPITGQVWEYAIALAEKSRTKGQSFPYPDLIIFACSKLHGAELFHRDNYFDALANIA